MTPQKISFKEGKHQLENTFGINVNNVKYVYLSDLVPSDFDWFWAMIECNDAPCSYGDNDFSMITGKRLTAWLEDCFETWNQGANATATTEAWNKFIDSIWLCNDAGIFINLEFYRKN